MTTRRIDGPSRPRRVGRARRLGGRIWLFGLLCLAAMAIFFLPSQASTSWNDVLTAEGRISVGDFCPIEAGVTFAPPVLAPGPSNGNLVATLTFPGGLPGVYSPSGLDPSSIELRARDDSGFLPGFATPWNVAGNNRTIQFKRSDVVDLLDGQEAGEFPLALTADVSGCELTAGASIEYRPGNGPAPLSSEEDENDLNVEENEQSPDGGGDPEQEQPPADEPESDDKQHEDESTTEDEDSEQERTEDEKEEQEQNPEDGSEDGEAPGDTSKEPDQDDGRDDDSEDQDETGNEDEPAFENPPAPPHWDPTHRVRDGMTVDLLLAPGDHANIEARLPPGTAMQSMSRDTSAGGTRWMLVALENGVTGWVSLDGIEEINADVIEEPPEEPADESDAPNEQSEDEHEEPEPDPESDNESESMTDPDSEPEPEPKPGKEKDADPNESSESNEAVQTSSEPGNRGPEPDRNRDESVEDEAGDGDQEPSDEPGEPEGDPP